jgi:hypothetical protein
MNNRILGLLTMTALLLSVTATEVAQAAEGPFWKVKEKRLEAGEEKIKGEADESFVLKVTGITVTCKTLSFNAAANIKGNTGKNSATSAETITFSGCSVSGNGEGCLVENEKIETEPLTNVLAYEKADRTAFILVEFKPTKGEAFAVIKFKPELGHTCTVNKTTVEGSAVAAYAVTEVGSEVIPVGPGKEAVVIGVKFPGVTVTKDFIENGGVITEIKPGLKAFGKEATLEGLADIELEGKVKWTPATE